MKNSSSGKSPRRTKKKIKRQIELMENLYSNKKKVKTEHIRLGTYIVTSINYKCASPYLNKLRGKKVHTKNLCYYIIFETERPYQYRESMLDTLKLSKGLKYLWRERGYSEEEVTNAEPIQSWDI